MSHPDRKYRVFRMEKLTSKIASEEYCCMKGYLELCAARGENARGMAKNFNLHRFTIYAHYRRLRAGEYLCEGRGNCLKAAIEEIKEK